MTFVNEAVATLDAQNPGTWGDLSKDSAEAETAASIRSPSGMRPPPGPSRASLCMSQASAQTADETRY